MQRYFCWERNPSFLTTTADRSERRRIRWREIWPVAIWLPAKFGVANRPNLIATLSQFRSLIVIDVYRVVYSSFGNSTFPFTTHCILMGAQSTLKPLSSISFLSVPSCEVAIHSS